MMAGAAMLAAIPVGAAWGQAVSLDDDEVRQAAIARGVEVILSMQEGPDEREWPYQGVYRVRGEIPIGYRIGGTSICGMALLMAPDGFDDPKRSAALTRAVEFVCEGPFHPLMAHDFEATYDVRGWGYTFALQFLLELKAAQATPAGMDAAVEEAIAFSLQGIVATEIPERGGWNYARRGGFAAPGPAAPFMTAPTLQALFAAARHGYDVDSRMVDRGLASLARARGPSGTFVYSGQGPGGRRNAVPGAVGRMLVGESTLYLAGRADQSDVRGAVDAFFVHWDWLDKRRAQSGTHDPPYSVAPYYFYFAHYYAGQAIELLPDSEKPEYRRRLRETLTGVRLEDGSWNDRVFDRSANYGTAMSIMALLMADAPPPAGWPTRPGDQRPQDAP